MNSTFQNCHTTFIGSTFLYITHCSSHERALKNTVTGKTNVFLRKWYASFLIFDITFSSFFSLSHLDFRFSHKNDQSLYLNFNPTHFTFYLTNLITKCFIK